MKKEKQKYGCTWVNPSLSSAIWTTSIARRRGCEEELRPRCPSCSRCLRQSQSEMALEWGIVNKENWKSLIFEGKVLSLRYFTFFCKKVNKQITWISRFDLALLSHECIKLREKKVFLILHQGSGCRVHLLCPLWWQTEIDLYIWVYFYILDHKSICLKDNVVGWL